MGDKDADTKFCSNCKKDISASNFTMHEMHCKRHIVLCKQCDEPVPRSEMDEHVEEFHAKVACTRCRQELEKPNLEDHMEKDCSKRPAKCTYCELEVPHSELATHSDYCGTRTEACPTCGQFIMKKDQLQHETSNCEYPAPKPSTNGRAPYRDIDASPYDEFEFMDPGFENGFAMNEISRMLDGPRGTLNSQYGTPGFGRRTNPPRMQARSYTNNDTTKTRKSTTNRRSELNRQRQRVTADPDSEDEEADRLLALQMARNMDSEQEIDHLIRQIEKRTPVQTPTSPEADGLPNVNTYPDDDELIPCEFCGEPFPVDLLVQHQSGCDPMASGAWHEDTSWRGERNNEVEGAPRGRNVAIPVINNLESEWTEPREVSLREAPPGYSPLEAEELDAFADGEEVMLPCEFCADPFPYDLLFQHQSVCDQNPLMTPRVLTPAANVRKKPQLRTENLLSPLAKELLAETNRSHRHQGNPEFPDFYDDSEDEIIDHLQIAEDRNHPKPGTRSHDTRSVVDKYGSSVDRFDNYLTKMPRAGARTRDEGSSRAGYSDSGRSQARRDSDSRTQNTLDKLLHDNGDLEHDLLAGVGNTRRKAAKNEDNIMKKETNATAGSRKKPLPATGATARTVMQELNRPANPPNGQRQKKRVNGSHDEGPPFEIQAVGSRAPRQRSTVFSPEVRGHASQSRPSQQRPRQKHPSNRRQQEDL